MLIGSFVSQQKEKSMYLDSSTVRQNLSLSSLLEVLSDVFDRYSKRDPSLQQPLRSVLSIGHAQK